MPSDVRYALNFDQSKSRAKLRAVPFTSLTRRNTTSANSIASWASDRTRNWPGRNFRPRCPMRVDVAETCAIAREEARRRRRRLLLPKWNTHQEYRRTKDCTDTSWAASSIAPLLSMLTSTCCEHFDVEVTPDLIGWPGGGAGAVKFPF